MRINSLHIENFRAIELLSIQDLEKVVLIVGKNGVGKSCIFDAIRLLKSSYGGYNPNEWQNWFNEFQLKVRGNEFSIDKILRNKKTPLKIGATFNLDQREISFLEQDGEKLIQTMLWRHYTKNPQLDIDEFTSAFAENNRMYADRVRQETAQHLSQLKAELNKNQLKAEVVFPPNGEPNVEENIVLELIFNTFLPDRLGIIDYHGAHRDYKKENISNLNVRFEENSDQYKGHTLYNYANKYNNVKNELASSYVKALIARESGQEVEAIDSLNNSLSELFTQFFPGKSFKGIVPGKDGKLTFPVELASGQSHDIGELSSGEKEVLFGYVRLRNQAPKNSIILIDEPELHLNPDLAKNLPEFYRKTIGEELNNQMWLVTHSDAILKEAIGHDGYSIFHMSEASEIQSNQLRGISLKKDIEAVLIDLIGDISSYHYGNKVVVFEGKNSEFDKTMVNKLFPEFEDAVNSISAGDRSSVLKVQEILEQAKNEGIIQKEFVSIVDRDSSSPSLDDDNLSQNQLQWDAYHIENYLLDEHYIFLVLEDLEATSTITNIDKVVDGLKLCAKEVIDFHHQHELNLYVKSEVLNSLNFSSKGDTEREQEFHDSIKRSVVTLNEKIDTELSRNNLIKVGTRIRQNLEDSLIDNLWKSDINGRMILKKFVGKYCSGVRYERFRNLIISKMKADNFQPKGMKKVVETILKN
jgi:predicted ATPase